MARLWPPVVRGDLLSMRRFDSNVVGDGVQGQRSGELLPILGLRSTKHGAGIVTPRLSVLETGRIMRESVYSNLAQWQLACLKYPSKRVLRP